MKVAVIEPMGIIKGIFFVPMSNEKHYDILFNIEAVFNHE